MCAVCCVCVCVLSADGECESSLMSSYDLRISIGVLDTLMGMGLETNLQCAYMRVSIQQTIAEAQRIFRTLGDQETQYDRGGHRHTVAEHAAVIYRQTHTPSTRTLRVC